MIKFSYYIVTSYFDNFPFFTTCAEINGEFFRISNLEEYFKDGISGVSNEKVNVSSFKLITDKHFTI